MSDPKAPRLPWWRVMKRAAVKDTQGSLWSAAMQSERLSGRDNPRVRELWARYHEHVRAHGWYDIPTWRTR